MGNGLNILKAQYKTSFMDDHLLMRTEYDQRFGEITVYKDKSSEKLVLSKERVFESEDQFENYIKSVKLRSNIQGDNICPKVYFESENQGEWCSEFYKVKIAFEYHDVSLDKLLRELKTSNPKKQVWFTQDESIIFQENIISILKTFGNEGYIHGDIQHSNVFVVENGYNKDKHLKILDLCLLNDFETGYTRCLTDCDYRSPLSPSALASLSLRDVKGDYNKPKNDVFAAGITLQSAIFNEDFTKYYSWSRYSINKDTIRNRLSTLLKFGYNSTFVKVIARMCEFSDIERYSVNELASSYEKIKELFKRHSSLRHSAGNYNQMFEDHINNKTLDNQKDFQYIKKNLENYPNSTRETYGPYTSEDKKVESNAYGRKTNLVADRYQKLELMARNELNWVGDANDTNKSFSKVISPKYNTEINYRNIYNSKDSTFSHLNAPQHKENLGRGFMYNSGQQNTQNLREKFESNY